MASSFNEALRRMGGMYGEAYRDGRLLSEAVEVTGATEINRIEVPLVGTTKVGYKPGRETREGTIRIQKIDTSWELELQLFLSTGLAERRAARGTPAATLRPFSIVVKIDDPDAYGVESWQLDGCLLWRRQFGFSITDDILEREYPLTWENEIPLNTFTVDEQGSVTIIDSTS